MKTEILQLDVGKLDLDGIGRAAEIVDGGGLVGFPTETVYGVACRVEKESLSRLDEAKGRPGDKRYSLHIGSADELTEYVPQIPLAGAKLVSEFWPGPLTLVFELNEEDLAVQRARLNPEVFDVLYQDGSIGVRCPDNPVSKELLKACKRPVVAPSANLSGRPPAVTADEVIEQLDGRIDMLLAVKKDQQNCDFRQSSTVVKLGGGKLEVLREGVIEKNRILEKSVIQILFVCTGNTCRSPLCEYLCKKYISKKLNSNLDELADKGYKVISAGVNAFDGFPASPEVVDLCSEMGIDASTHKSRCLTAEMVEKSDIIFTMTKNHRQMILSMYPQAAGKCFLLAGEKDIADPIGGGKQIYRACAKEIDKALELKLCEIMR